MMFASVLHARIQSATDYLRTSYWRLRYYPFVHCDASAIKGRLVQVGIRSRSLSIQLMAGSMITGPGVIAGSGIFRLGPGSYINPFVVIGVDEEITIGADCLIASNVGLRDSDHVFDDPTVPIGRQGSRSAPIRIGDHVWIGHGATILKGVTIGDGAVVAAGAVVREDVQPGEIVGGVPARVLRRRFEQSDND